MPFRKNFLPRQVRDWLCCAIIVIYMPLYSYLWLTHIMPAIHGTDGFWYIFNNFLAAFILLNILLNYFACILTDTSFVRNSQSSALIEKGELFYENWHYCENLYPFEDWHYCQVCKHNAPPRAWHCKTCGICILKRDHHCWFTGCCVGHNNQRYFMVFLAFMGFGLIYAFIYHSVYLWIVKADAFPNLITPIKPFWPNLNFFHGTFWQNFLLVLNGLNFIFIINVLGLLAISIYSILHGRVLLQRREYSSLYDNGLSQNLRNVFGERMHLVWLSPFIRSNLPHDGIHWQDIIKLK